MLTLKGDFAKLQQWAKKIDQAGKDQALRELSANLAEEALDLVADGFRREQDPDKRKWKRKKKPDGRQILVGKTARLRRGWHRKANSSRGFTIGPSVNYAKYHQSGTKRMVARPMVPGKRLPAHWKRAFDAIAQAYFVKRFR